MYKTIIYIFSRNLKKVLGFTEKFRKGRATLNTGILFIWPYINIYTKYIYDVKCYTYTMYIYDVKCYIAHNFAVKALLVHKR